MADAPITFFVPLGNDRSNAGLTVRAETIDELSAVLTDLTDSVTEDPSKLDGLLDSTLAIKAALELKGLNSAAPAQAPRQSTHPQASASAPADAPTCAHGPMDYKAGTSAKGNAYKGWFCPAPYGQTKCPPKFIK